VFDDYVDFLDLMRDMLGSQAGHEVVCFDGGETSFEEIASSLPDLLIVDLRLARHGISGSDLLSLARADRRLLNTPVIVCSSDVPQLEARRDEFSALGDVWVLPKPFEADGLQQLVASLLPSEVRAVS
jgi:CheY-like chemotaxis protein